MYICLGNIITKPNNIATTFKSIKVINYIKLHNQFIIFDAIVTPVCVTFHSNGHKVATAIASCVL